MELLLKPSQMLKGPTVSQSNNYAYLAEQMHFSTHCLKSKILLK